MNEPVAWRIKNKNGEWLYYDEELVGTEPLYAHPVKELDEQFKKGFKAGKEEGWKAHKFYHPVKELTDEEIRHIQAQCHLKDVGYDGFIMRFARAILRKAQE